MKFRVVKLSNGKWAAQKRHLFGWKYLTATNNNYEYWRPIEYCWVDSKEEAVDIAHGFGLNIIEVEEIT